MSIGKTAFNAIYSAMPDARAILRGGHAETLRALVVSAGSTLSSSEQGLYAAGDLNARILQDDDPPGGEYALGKLIEVQMATGHTQTYRIAARTITAGVLRMTLEGITD